MSLMFDLLLKVKKNFKQFLALSIFLSSCFKTSGSTSSEQREKIESFFEELLLEHGGAYTLLGSKPMTVEELFDCSEEERLNFQQYLNEHPEIESVLVDRKLEEGWKEWKKFSGSDAVKKFLLTEIRLASCELLLFVNIEKTVSVISDFYDEFKRVIGRDFDPRETVMELKSKEKGSWRKILSDFKTMGILFGYGYKNASLFERRGDFAAAEPSENNDPRVEAECYLNNKPFRIPIFVKFDEAESSALVEKYKNEREEIKKIYKGKNFLDETLAQLNR